jgi:hypothetical protein
MKGKQSMVRRLALAVIGIGWIVSEVLILEQVPQHIYSEAVDPLGQPVPHNFFDFVANFRIAPVEVGLARKKRVVIKLSG